MVLETREGNASVGAFLAACEAGDLLEVLRLATLIGDIDMPDSSGKTGLMAAAARNRLEVMALLLKHGADPGKANANGTTALMFAKTAAFAYGDCEGMQILLEAGADKNARDKAGMTALDYTIRNSDRIKKFLENY